MRIFGSCLKRVEDVLSYCSMSVADVAESGGEATGSVEVCSTVTLRFHDVKLRHRGWNVTTFVCLKKFYRIFQSTKSLTGCSSLVRELKGKIKILSIYKVESIKTTKNNKT